MNKKEREELSTELDNEIERIQNEHSTMDITNYIADEEDMEELSDIDIYDYNLDIDSAKQMSKTVVHTLADLYLGDVPAIRNHAYIANKIAEDASAYGNVLLLDAVTTKNYLHVSRLIDAGENLGKYFDVLTNLTKEMRENAKLKITQRTELEKFYSNFRADFGLNTLSESSTLGEGVKSDEATEESTKVYDTNQLNDLIERTIREQRESERKKKG